MRGTGIFIGIVALAVSTPLAGAERQEQSLIDALVAQIMATIQAVPEGSGIGGYEGQIALTIDRASQPCPVVQAALLRARGLATLEYANRAVRALQVSYQRCGGGVTSLSGRGGLATAFGPAFTIGAGSANYQQ